MRKTNNIIKIINLIFMLCFICFLISCQSNYKSQGYDGKQFDISLNQDNSLIAITNKIGNDYSLTISGVGESIDYEKKELVPWNILSKKIISVQIENGITKIGSYLFYTTNLKEVIIPESVTTLSINSFNDSIIIYSYGKEVYNNTNAKIYYYCDTKPNDDGNYFKLVDGKPQIWKNLSFLFIGNSFTFRQGSEDNPMIPKMFKELAESLDIEVTIDFVLRSSYTLLKYASVNDELGKVVDEKIKNNNYDYIILQEQSTTPINSYNNFYNAVGLLKNKIESYQNNAKIFLYETWGSPTGIEGTKYNTIAEMEEDLYMAYTNCKNDYKLNITYVGKAFTYIIDNYPNINLYAEDNRHQSNIGAYLSACAHIVSMLDIDVRKSNYLGGLDNDTANILKEVAYLVINNK